MNRKVDTQMDTDKKTHLPAGRRGLTQINVILVTGYWLLVTGLSGCVTIYPYATSEEIKSAQEELKVKALKFKIEQLVKVNNVGFQLIKSLPEEDKRGEFVYSGLLLAEIDEYLKRLYNLSEDWGVVIVGKVKESPAERAGFLAGDIIDKCQDRKVRDIKDIVGILKRYRPKDKIDFEVIRGEKRLTLTLILGSKPVDVSFKLHDSQEVNAGATENLIVATYGLLRFLKSEDELAVVLGHELAHITRDHLLKVRGADLISMILGIAAGIGMESVSPGAGDITARVISSAFGVRFSREFEKEADYFGLRYAYLAAFNIEEGSEIWERFAIEVPSSLTENFFSTHPTSAERLVRIEKAVSEIKQSQ